MTGLSRRTALGLIGGGAVVAVGGAVAIGATSDAGLVRAVLERYLGRLRMADADLAAFIADFTDGKSWLMPQGKLARGYQIAHAVGADGAALSVLGGADRAGIELFERRMLGAFHTTTDIGFRTSPDDTVSYIGETACLNPFATFDV